MYFYCICAKEGDLRVLLFRHLLSLPCLIFDTNANPIWERVVDVWQVETTTIKRQFQTHLFYCSQMVSSQMVGSRLNTGYAFNFKWVRRIIWKGRDLGNIRDLRELGSYNKLIHGVLSWLFFFFLTSTLNYWFNIFWFLLFMMKSQSNLKHYCPVWNIILPSV